MYKNTILGLLFIAASWANVIDLHIAVNGNGDFVESLDRAHESANCYWSGTSPFCAGSCDANDGYTACQTDSCGDGACCVTGYKKKCCKGGCSSSTNPSLDGVSAKTHDVKANSKELNAQDEPENDMCKEDQLLCCPAGASRNKECQCVDKKRSAHSAGRTISRLLKSQRGLQDNPDNDLCKDGEDLCCNPGAVGNKDCQCLKIKEL